MTRRFGSKAILRLKLPDKAIYTDKHRLRMFLLRPIMIWNWEYRFLCAKDATALFFNTTLMPLEEVLEWANPLEDNQNQVRAEAPLRINLLAEDLCFSRKYVSGRRG
jgi:hypothetical protein